MPYEDRNYLQLVNEIHLELGIPGHYAHDRNLHLFEEAHSLVTAEVDANGKVHQLTEKTSQHWKEMKHAAARDGIHLIMVSGFRGVDYQAGLIRKKLEQGQIIGNILKVLAAPGYSEHHTGRAIDITSPDCPPCTEQFELTDAFAWLNRYAGEFDFSLSFPRGNRHGFVYEPWHWACHDRSEFLQ
ncbi:MAG: M15 family metallopeptidase [Gammaproteobacteria bacterium]|nr:M15 family metallopeptidase [Gammaproteobacteria bacterium]